MVAVRNTSSQQSGQQKRDCFHHVAAKRSSFAASTDNMSGTECAARPHEPIAGRLINISILTDEYIDVVMSNQAGMAPVRPPGVGKR